MAKTDLGTKRVCLSCGAKFYDLGKVPTVCPACGHEAAPEAFQNRRSPAPETPKPAAAEKPAAKNKKKTDNGGDDDIDDDLLVDDDDDETVLDGDELDNEDDLEVDVNVDVDDEK